MLSLDARLLCACLQSYEIVQAGIAPNCPGNPAPSSLVGWTSPPRCYVGGPSGIDAMLVGETATEIIVAFRGTEPVNDPDRRQALLDWANDIAGLPVAASRLPGLVHLGFSRSVSDLWDQAWPEAQVLAKASPQKPLYVTGHSKGGALAPLAAMLYVAEGLKPRVRTFAAARCGDVRFASAYAKAVPDSVRYEYADDIVPHLPPSEGIAGLLLGAGVPIQVLGYASVGALKFINWSGQIVGDSPALELQRAARLAERLVSCDFGTILDNHYIDPGSGYAKAICPGVWT